MTGAPLVYRTTSVTTRAFRAGSRDMSARAPAEWASVGGRRPGAGADCSLQPVRAGFSPAELASPPHPGSATHFTGNPGNGF